MEEIEILRRKQQRELKARLAAESILETKSLELHEAKLAAETALKELETRKTEIEAIVDCAAEGIISIDHDFRVSKFNRAASRIFQVNSTDAIGLSFEDFFEDFQGSELTAFMASAKTRLDPTEYLIQNTETGSGIVEVTISKINDDLQSALIAIVRDRTKSKHLEAQLALAQKMESIGQLSAGIAHEINSPMQYVNDNTRFLKDAFCEIESLFSMYDELVTTVKSHADTTALLEKIGQKCDDSEIDFLLEEVPEAIDQTLAGAERVTSIVGAMKVFSHPGQKTMSEFNLNKSIDSTITVTKNEWKYFASIRKSLTPNLPNCYGDQGKVNQVLLNLIVNAAHAINKRYEKNPHIEGIIQIETCEDEGFIEVSIQDNGCGIPKNELQQIFDPFFTTKPVGKGTGQGLAITHSIVVEIHGGTIDVESTVGVGTKFTIRLPQKHNSKLYQQGDEDERTERTGIAG